MPKKRDKVATATPAHRAPVLFVGDPPAFDGAEKAGHPFTGKGGKLFDDGIEAAGFKGREYAKTFCAWYSDGDEVGTTFKKQTEAAKGSLYPKLIESAPEIVVPCGATALKLLCGEKYKIADWVGKKFLHKFMHEGSEVEFVVQPMWTPGYLFHNDHLLDKYFDGFKRVRETLKNIEAVKQELASGGEGEYEVLTEFDKCMAAIDRFEKAGEEGQVTGWDLETSGLNPHTRKSKIGVLSLSVKPRTATVFIWDHAEVTWTRGEKKAWYARLRQYFSKSKRKRGDRRIKLVAQNGKFDCKWIKKHCGVMPELFADTMLMEHVLDENVAHGLKVQAVRHTDMGNYEEELEQYIPDKSAYCAFLKPPLHVVAKYAGCDADAALRIYIRHIEKINKKRQYQRIAMDLLPRASNYLAHMEYYGAKVDVAYAQDYLLELEQKTTDQLKGIRAIPQVMKYVRRRQRILDKEYAEYEADRKEVYREKKREYFKALRAHEEACEAAGRKRKFNRVRPRWKKVKLRARPEPFEFNVNSVDQMRAVLYDYLGHDPVSYTDNEDPSTNKESLIHFKNENKCEFSKLILEYRVFSKLLSTYVRPLVENSQGYDTGHYIYGNFNLATTVTGRLSSTHPNLQNIPHKGAGGVKRCYVSRFKGGHLMQVDYSQIELRLAACFSGDKVMTKIYKEGGDIHLQTCMGIYGLTKSDYEALNKDDRKDKRRVAKVYNFGILYGMGAEGVVGSLKRDDPPIHLAIEEAEEHVEKFHKTYKGLYRWIESVKEHIREKGYYDSAFGRRRRLPEAKSTDHGVQARAERQGVNHPIQSSASDMTLISGIIIFEEMKRRKLKSLPVITIHDAIIFDVYPGETQEIMELAKEIMTNLPKYGHRVLGKDFSWDWLKLPIEVGFDFGYNWRDLIELGSKMEDSKESKVWKAYVAECEKKKVKPDEKKKNPEYVMKDWETCLKWSYKKMLEADKDKNREQNIWLGNTAQLEEMEKEAKEEVAA